MMWGRLSLKVMETPGLVLSLAGGSVGFGGRTHDKSNAPFPACFLRPQALDSDIQALHPSHVPHHSPLLYQTVLLGKILFENNPWPTHPPRQPTEISHITPSRAAQVQLATQIALFIFALFPQAGTPGDTHQGNHTASLKYL